MASSVWSSVQSAVPAAPTVAGADPAALLNTQLANALSTMGDAQYWEESIAPSTIRQSLATTDPSNSNSTPTLLRGMKWLLACISKGRDVSDFYPHVVKLVGAPSLEVKKMVYMYLVQYADHDNQTRELSLLSINSFQRGLADNEQLIRALALRVLTSIRVNDILQIQILAVQKCANDKSPYVRKCAANAIAKLHEQSLEAQQKQMLLDIMQKMLSTDTATMVLTSAVITFSEVCPERLDILHTSYRKLCNLLADMDEWGQVVVIDTLARYCRKFFAQPRGTGSAEAIDRTRRVLRTIHGIRAADTSSSVNLPAITSSTGTIPQLPERTGTRKIKRRVVRKGFYSDEEDESTEEEVYADSPGGAALPVATAMRNLANTTNATQPLSSAKDLEDEHLDDDHRLLLRSSLPLLKSRNSAVVLAVCSLHYYCGVASIRVRSSLGKALVRIHRDRREIQYAVLTAIRSLVTECPSAFTPYLQDFFVKGMDPSFTRMIKLDILTSLVLEPASIEAVMKELRTYIRHDDKVFVCAAIRAVGKVAELARIVHDRHGQKSGNVQKERKEANRVSMNALYGLMTLTQASFSDEVVGECAIVMERIILQLMSDSQGLMLVEDSNRIQELTIKRLLLLLTTSLSSRSIDEKASGDHVDDEDEDKGHVKITAKATASALWIVGEWLSSVGSISFHVSGFDDQVKRKTRLELARLVARVFPVMEPVEKMHSIHLATKLLVSATSGSTIDPKEGAVCEMILSMGRAEVNADVRDRARFESNLINSSFGLKYDTENTTVNMGGKSLSTDKVKHIMLHPKPPTSSLPLEDEQNQDCDELSGRFRFGTLSSLVNHRAKSAYLPLPRWASANSPSSLREEKSPNAAAGKRDSSDANNWKVDTEKKTTGFYDSDEESGVEEDESVGSDESDESEWDSDEDDDNSDDSDVDTSSEEKEESTPVVDQFSIVINPPKPNAVVSLPQPTHQQTTTINAAVNGGASLLDMSGPSTSKFSTQIEDEDDIDDSDEDEDDWDEDDSDDQKPAKPKAPVAPTSDLLNMGMAPLQVELSSHHSSNGSYAQGLEGLVMAPVVVDAEEPTDPDFDRDSSDWMDLVRHELGGGLSVKGRYLRGLTRDAQAQLIGLDPSKASVVVMQLQLENKRNDSGVVRRVRILDRKATPGVIGLRRSVVPPEISTLPKGKMTTSILGMDFASVSDKEGSLHARFEIKSDRGNNPLDLKPPLGELVKPLKMKADEFEKRMERLQGFQRVVSSFNVDSETMATLDKAILKQVNVKPLGSDKPWLESFSLRLVGLLPASTDKLYIEVRGKKHNGSGSFTVCSDNALATNSILDTLKKALKK